MRIRDLFYQCLSSVKDEIAKAQAAKEQQRATVEHARQNQVIYNYMSALRLDLFEAMHGHRYGRLSQIEMASDIRISDYKILKDGSIVYLFDLEKTDGGTIARTILDLVRVDMNRDIVSCHKDLCHNYGDIYVSQMFPFLYYGLHIIAIRDTGGTSVTIAVRSYW